MRRPNGRLYDEADTWTIEIQAATAGLYGRAASGTRPKSQGYATAAPSQGLQDQYAKTWRSIFSTAAGCFSVPLAKGKVSPV